MMPAGCGRRFSPPAAALHECDQAQLRFWIVGGGAHQHADAPHALALLRPRGVPAYVD